MNQKRPGDCTDSQSIVDEIAAAVVREHGEWNEDEAWHLLQQRISDATYDTLQSFVDRIKQTVITNHLPNPTERFAQATSEFHDQMQLRRDLELLRQTQKWPYEGTLMCLRHRRDFDDNGTRKVGVIWAMYPYTVLQINKYDLPMCGGAITMEEAFAKRVDYASHEDLLKDWAID